MAEDPAAFHSMLPMYRVKFLYAEVLSALSNVMQPVAAVRAISVFSTLLFGLVALLVAALGEGARAGAGAWSAILIVAGFADAARAGAPDMLASALMLAGLYAYTRRWEALTAVLLFLAFLVRPDNIAFLGVFAVLLVLFRQWSWGALAAFAASFAAYVPISHWAGHPGWWPHFYFTNIEPQLTMDGFEPAFSLALYAKAFVAGVVKALIRRHLGRRRPARARRLVRHRLRRLPARPRVRPCCSPHWCSASRRSSCCSRSPTRASISPT